MPQPGSGRPFRRWALRSNYARLHGMDRVIYVAPFLTAIEQTAKAFRLALNDRKSLVVLEDHSTAERDAEWATGGSTASADEVVIAVRDKLRENWDVLVIVISNVQFLECLHVHDAGRCRKLHRIANAVVLFDE